MFFFWLGFFFLFIRYYAITLSKLLFLSLKLTENPRQNNTICIKNNLFDLREKTLISHVIVIFKLLS